MNSQFEKLLSTGKIGTMELRNRYVMSPMVTNYCAEDGKPTERFIAYHEARAKGGAGLIIVEATYVVKEGQGFPNEAGIHQDENIPKWKEYTDRIHKHGAKCAVQLYHGGRQTSSAVTGAPLEAPSAIPCPIMQGDPAELSVSRIKELVQAFGAAASRAKEAGFDAVEIHGAHGYLINQFLSPYSNKRTDEYGGCTENRERFAMEIIDAVKEAVGDDYPIIFRLSAEEFVDGGLTIEDTKEFAKKLVAKGIHAIHCSGGVYETASYIIQPAALPRGLYVDNAAAIKEAIDSAIPVMTVGRLKDPVMAEQVLEDGKADFIVTGRSFLADPEFVNKLKEGRACDIRRCVACNQGCIDRLFVGLPIGCMINPMTGHETEYDLSPAKESKRVLVVGSGPAGLEAARVAAIKGHKVILCEKDEFLGGQLNVATLPPHKEELKDLLNYQIKAVNELDVDIRLNTEVTVQFIKETAPEAVIIATGSQPLVLRIPGVDLPNVVTGHDVLKGAEIGKNVAVIGGGLVGCETAEALAAQGKQVTVLEMLDGIAGDMGLCAKLLMLQRIAEAGIVVKTNSKVKEIKENGLVVETNAVMENLDGIDTVVLAAGAVANKGLMEILDEENIPYSVIGDSKKPRQILQAMEEGFLTAMNL